MRSVRDKVERVRKAMSEAIDREGLKDTVRQAVEMGKQAYRDSQDAV